MHIGRFSAQGDEQFWGVIDAETGTVAPIMQPLAAWAPSAARGSLEAAAVGEPRPLTELKLLVPLEPGGRIFGAGMNYATHLDDSGTSVPPPEHMIGFLKLTESAIAADSVIRHPQSEQLDFEIELVAILAAPLAPNGDATESLLGYTLGNDVSVRDAPRPGGMVDLYTMKAQDGTTPIGPWIVTLDAIGGPGQPAIGFELRVNGEMRQRDNSENMLWSVDRLLRSIDARNRLRAGDLLFTGTTGGTGMLESRFLQPGDEVELEADGIGLLRNSVGARETA